MSHTQGPLEWAAPIARWLGSIPNRLTNFLDTHTTNQGVKMIRSFACDYETLKRLAEIETDAILYQGDAEFVTGAVARDYALRIVLGEIERARAVEAKRKETFDSAFNFAIKLTVAVETGSLGLSPSEYREAHTLLEALNEFAKHLK